MSGDVHVRICERLGVQLPRATRLVIVCKPGKAAEALQHLRAIMGKLKLTVNEEKTRICKIPEDHFDFLGYTFGRLYSPRTGQARMGLRPSRKSISRVIAKIHVMTAEAMAWQGVAELVRRLNRSLYGWANYFQVGTVRPAYRLLDNYTRARLRRWLRNKHKVRRRWAYLDSYLYDELGLLHLSRMSQRNPSWAKA